VIDTVLHQRLQSIEAMLWFLRNTKLVLAGFSLSQYIQSFQGAIREAHHRHTLWQYPI